MLTINKTIIFFIILKITSALVFFVIMPNLFDQSIFKFNDVGYYLSGDLGLGPNIGYRWLIAILGINELNEILPIFLASLLNISIDIVWIYLFSKHLNLRALFIFTLLLGLQPYAAIYTMKFTTVIFAKIGLLFFCWQIFQGDFDKLKQKTLSLAEFLFWTILTSIRNSNIFIAAPYFILKMRKRPVLGIILSSVFVYFFYYMYGIHLDGLNPSNRPWSLEYTKELLGINNTFLVLPILLIARLLLLFGAREKLYGEGIEPFLVWGTPGIELLVYILLGCLQFVGFLIAFRYFFQRNGAPLFILLIPLALAIFTVAHQRYLIPFIPMCLFGISLFLQRIIERHK